MVGGFKADKSRVLSNAQKIMHTRHNHFVFFCSRGVEAGEPAGSWPGLIQGAKSDSRTLWKCFLHTLIVYYYY